MAQNKVRRNTTATLVFVAVVLLAAIVILDAIQPRYTKTEKSSVAMGTVVTQKLYSDEDCSRALQEINGIITETEALISGRIAASQISELNREHSVVADESVAEMLEICNRVYVDSEGAFDITTGKLTALWNIGDENAAVPEKDEIEEALACVDGSLVKLEGNKVTIGKNQLVDPGAVGKGAVCDYIKDYLETTDIYGAVILVGGSVLLYGNNPDGDSWKVAVRNPGGESNDSMGTFTLEEGFVSTSGDYERVLEAEGKSYHHILDPKTGYPSDTDLTSVTVVCDSGIIGDALSTAAFILGREKGMKLLEKYDAQGIFVEKDGCVYLTEGIKNNFVLADDSFRVMK